MKKGISCIVFLLMLINSVSSATSKPNYDSSRFFIKINNSFINNSALTGFNNRFSFGAGLGCYTSDISVSGFSKPIEYIHSAEYSYGKRFSCSVGLNTRFKNEAAFVRKEMNVAFSMSLQTLKLGDFRIGLSGSTLNYAIDFSNSFFGDQINPKIGFIYQTIEILPQSGLFKLYGITRYNAGIFYSYKNIFYAGYSRLDINEPMVSFFKENESVLHSMSIATAGGRFGINRDFDLYVSALIKNTKYYGITQVQPSVGLGYKSKYYFGTGINLVNSAFNSYYVQLYADFFKCTTVAFKYELLKESYFSNSLSPAYWGISSTFYIDRILKH